MFDPVIAFVLLGCIAAVSIGAAKLVSWCIDRRGESSRRSAREAALIAGARAGYLDRTAYFRAAEIAAAKRGDLLAAAVLAEEQEGSHVS